MKLKIYFPTFLFILILINSCSINKNYVTQRKLEIQNAKDADRSCFVELNDGTINNYSTLVLVIGLLKTPHLIADGKIKIEAKNIRAYQNDEHYAISQSVYNPKRRSYVAVESLPGFAIRIAKGDLNIYVRKSNNNNKAVDEFFLQTGNYGEITAYSPVLMNDVIKTSPEALDLFNSKKYRSVRPKLKAAAEIFNNSQSVTRLK